jgi:hypothetical protein
MAQSKRSLGQIIHELETLCERIEAENLEPALITDFFQELQGELADKVDSWIAYLDSVNTYQEHVKKKVDSLQKRKKTLDNLQEQLKGYLVWCMEQTKMPQLRGSEGSIKVYRNSQPRLNVKLPVEKLSFGAALRGMQHAELLKDFPEFLEETKILVLDTDALKKALLAGRNIDFADLTFGQHVRIIQ